MKTLITCLFVALSLAVSSTSFAQNGDAPIPTEPVQTDVRPAKNGKVDVIVGKTDSNLLIQLVDKQGRTLVSKSVYKQTSASRIRFDLNELPDGIYEVVITDGVSRQAKDVVLDTHTSATYRTITMS